MKMAMFAVVVMGGMAMSCADRIVSKLDDPVMVLKTCNAYNHALAFMTRQNELGNLSQEQIAYVDDAVAGMAPVCEGDTATSLTTASMVALDGMIRAQLAVGGN